MPNAARAIIEQEKITNYLLATGHPAGLTKAGFFQRFGFTAARWQALRDALLEHGRSARVASSADTPFEKKYILDGPLTASDGRKPGVRTVWFVRAGEDAPRFVTAYPLPGVRR